MMLIRIKQHSTNTWDLIHKKVKDHWGCWKESAAYKK